MQIGKDLLFYLMNTAATISQILMVVLLLLNDYILDNGYKCLLFYSMMWSVTRNAMYALELYILRHTKDCIFVVSPAFARPKCMVGMSDNYFFGIFYFYFLMPLIVENGFKLMLKLFFN
jgi:hypothetical protein